MTQVHAAMHATTGLAGFLVGMCFIVVALGVVLFARRFSAFNTNRGQVAVRMIEWKHRAMAAMPSGQVQS